MHIYIYMEQIELQAKLLNYLLGSNKSNINQYSAYAHPVTSVKQMCTLMFTTSV